MTGNMHLYRLIVVKRLPVFIMKLYGYVDWIEWLEKLDSLREKLII
jgi:hypothetical protein